MHTWGMKSIIVIHCLNYRTACSEDKKNNNRIKNNNNNNNPLTICFMLQYMLGACKHYKQLATFVQSLRQLLQLVFTLIIQFL